HVSGALAAGDRPDRSVLLLGRVRALLLPRHPRRRARQTCLVKPHLARLTDGQFVARHARICYACSGIAVLQRVAGCAEVPSGCAPSPGLFAKVLAWTVARALVAEIGDRPLHLASHPLGFLAGKCDTDEALAWTIARALVAEIGIVKEGVVAAASQQGV